MAITIKDVAARAGVSVTTVSKILNRRPGISEETTQRVEQVMRELEYAAQQPCGEPCPSRHAEYHLSHQPTCRHRLYEPPYV